MKKRTNPLSTAMHLMFFLGTEPHEISRCLTKCRTQLIAKGAKAGNLPKGLEQEVLFVCQLGANPLNVVRNWFVTNCTFDELPDASDALCEVEGIRYTDIEAAEKSMPIWRSLLGAFVNPDCPAAVEAFLRPEETLKQPAANARSISKKIVTVKKIDREIKHIRSNGKVPLVVTETPDQSTPSSSIITVGDSNRKIRSRRDRSVISEGDPIALERRNKNTSPSVSGERQPPLRPEAGLAGASDQVGHKTAMSSVLNAPKLKRARSKAIEPESSVERLPLAPAPDSGRLVSGRTEPLVDSVGFKVGQPLKLGAHSIENPEEYPILGVCTKQLPTGQFFIRIVAIMVNDDVIELTQDEAKRLFPTTGDATCFADQSHSHSYVQDQFVITKVEHHETTKSTQFSVKGLWSMVHEVVQIPHDSTETERVTYWLQEIYETNPAVRPIFQLSDGVIIRLNGDITNPRKANFEIPFDGFISHPAILWRGRMLVMKPLPAPDFKYDCTPLATAIKRVFKARSELVDFPTITKAQLQMLADFVTKDGRDNSVKNSAMRAKNHLGEIFEIKELLDETVSCLLKLPEIEEQLQHEKKKILDGFKVDAEASNLEISNLRKEIKALKAEVDRKKQTIKSQSGELSREIGKAFQRASEEGVKTLANAALFSALLSSRASNLGTSDIALKEISRSGGSLTVDMPQEVALTPAQNLVSIKELLRALDIKAFAQGLSLSVMKSMIAAAASTGIVGLVGSRQRVFAAALGSILAEGCACSVSISGDMFGLSDLLSAPAILPNSTSQGLSLGEFLEQQQRVDKFSFVVLRGFNRAPPESFLPELLDVAGYADGARAMGWTDRSGRIRTIRFAQPVVFVLDFVAGRSSFPLVPPLAYEIPVIDTDAEWGDEAEPDPIIKSTPSYIAPSAWASLAGSGQDTADGAINVLTDGAKSPARRMCFAALELGMPVGEATATALLAYGIGRHDIDTLLKGTENMTGGQVSNVQSSIRSSSSGLLGRIFDMH